MFRPLKVGGTLYSGVDYFFLFFFVSFFQNQVPQIIMKMGLVLYHIKDLTVVVRTTMKSFKKVFLVLRINGLKFWFFDLYRANKASEKFYFSDY